MCTSLNKNTLARSVLLVSKSIRKQGPIKIETPWSSHVCCARYERLCIPFPVFFLMVCQFRHVCRPAVQPVPVPANQQVLGQVAEEGHPQMVPSAAQSAIEDDVFNITVTHDTEEIPEHTPVEQGTII